MNTNDLIDTMYHLADKITDLVRQRQFDNLPDYMKRTAISDAYRSEVNWDSTSDVDDAMNTFTQEFVSNAETCGVETPLLTRLAIAASETSTCESSMSEETFDEGKKRWDLIVGLDSTVEHEHLVYHSPSGFPVAMASLRRDSDGRFQASFGHPIKLQNDWLEQEER